MMQNIKAIALAVLVLAALSPVTATGKTGAPVPTTSKTKKAGEDGTTCCYRVLLATNDCDPFITVTKSFRVYNKFDLAPFGSDGFPHICCTDDFTWSKVRDNSAKKTKCTPGKNTRFYSMFVGGL